MTNIDFCLGLHQAHAKLLLKLDDELGTYHGISFGDFATLKMLAQQESGRLRMSELARPAGQPLSVVMRQLIALEKIGLVVREENNGLREVTLRPAGRSLVNVARETADNICTEAVNSILPSSVETVAAAMNALGSASALRI
jgi:MarR family transcriptional regulator, organic hydroperoxide resistance regulator